MRPTETLVHEHEVILVMLESAEREAHAIGKGARADATTLGKMLDFFQHFADHCHHAKEEKLLFPRMNARGMPLEIGPLAVMLAEHHAGRRLLKAVAHDLPQAAKGNRTALEALSQNLGDYVKLLRDHIAKENEVLFPMADEMLSAEDQQELEEAFEKVERTEMGPGVHEKYHQLAHALANR